MHSTQQRFMERMQEAQNQGVSLPDYYRAHGLSMAMVFGDEPNA
jgi:hypothetical protein